MQVSCSEGGVCGTDSIKGWCVEDLCISLEGLPDPSEAARINNSDLVRYLFYRDDAVVMFWDRTSSDTDLCNMGTSKHYSYL